LMVEKKTKKKTKKKPAKRGRPKRPVGRPCKLTPELQEKIAQAILAGAYVETAAAYAGISKETFYDWLKQGAKQKRGKYKDFSDAIKKAMAESELRDIATLTRASSSQWQAAAWKLERRFPQRWGRREKVELEGSSEAIKIEYVKRKPEDAG